MFKKATVVMLPTNQESNFQIHNNRLIYYNRARNYGDNSMIHLYIVSDEEIKEGDAYYNIIRNEIQICENYIEVSSLKHAPEHAKKVIATTDSSLSLICTCGNIKTVATGLCTKCYRFTNITPLPQPSQSFIDKYITEYNNHDIITDIMVEYAGVYTDFGDKEPCHYELKVNSKYNIITIKKIKDSWTRDEVSKLMQRSIEQAFIYPETFTYGICLDTNKSINWIKNNLYR